MVLSAALQRYGLSKDRLFEDSFWKRDALMNIAVKSFLGYSQELYQRLNTRYFIAVLGDVDEYDAIDKFIKERSVA